MKSELSSDMKNHAFEIIKKFRPIVSQFGFRVPNWNYDPEIGLLRVQFENPSQGNAVRIDYLEENNSYNAGYCTQKGDWEVCLHTKPKKLNILKKSLFRWINANCEECCVSCPKTHEVWEEDQYSLVPCSHCDDKGYVPKI